MASPRPPSLPVPAFLLAALALLLPVAAGVVVAEWDFLVHRIGTVEEGILYRSAQLGEAKLDEVVDKYGIRTIVNLTKVDLASDRAVAKARGLNYEWLPSEQVPPPLTIDRFRELMNDASMQPVLVHCEHGVGRTGVIAGVYRLEYGGWGIGRVLREARWYAFGGSYFDGQDKTRFLEALAERRATEDDGE